MKILKNFYKYMFSIDEKLITYSKKGKLYEHILLRIITFIVTIPLLYIIFFGYFNDGFNIMALIKTILFISVFRFFFKEFTDTILFIFFYKSSYKIDDSLKYTRKLKLKKLKLKSLFKL